MKTRPEYIYLRWKLAGLFGSVAGRSTRNILDPIIVIKIARSKSVIIVARQIRIYRQSFWGSIVAQSAQKNLWIRRRNIRLRWAHEIVLGGEIGQYVHLHGILVQIMIVVRACVDYLFVVTLREWFSILNYRQCVFISLGQLAHIIVC